jgi:hypothetical protein
VAPFERLEEDDGSDRRPDLLFKRNGRLIPDQIVQAQEGILEPVL